MSKKNLYLALLSMVLVIILAVVLVNFLRSSQNTNQTQTQPVVSTGDQQDSNLNELLKKPKIRVVVSFYPLADFTKQVGGQAVDVFNMTPAGTEPHDFEPKSMDIQGIYNAKLFVFNGAGLDVWAQDIQDDLQAQGVKTLNMSASFNILEPLETVGNNNEVAEEPSDDPHIWTDPVLVKKQVQLIKEALVSVDPERKAVYEQNAADYTSQLEGLDKQFRVGLGNCSQNTVVTSHNFLRYLSKEYGFNSIPISGISPDSEPSSSKLAEVAALVKSRNIRYIFTETLLSPKLSDTIAAETGARTLVLNPIEGLSDEEISKGENYISVQQQNLLNLKIALECK